jgi:hypothetical protein
MNLSRDGLSIENIFLKASVRLNLLKRTMAIYIKISDSQDFSTRTADDR